MITDVTIGTLDFTEVPDVLMSSLIMDVYLKCTVAGFVGY